MSDVFSKIGGFLGGKGGGVVGTGVGALSNFFANRTKNKYLQDQINYQKYLRSLTGDPAKLSAYVSGFEKPLDQGLVSGVNNQVQAFGAERGLSTSPQIMAEIEAQALGPLKQNQQQMAINEAMTALGLPSGDPGALLGAEKPMDLTAMIKQLLGGGKSGPQVVPVSDNPSKIDLPPTDPDVAPPPLEVPGGGDFDLSSLLSQFSGA